jgi:hypothetical protein
MTRILILLAISSLLMGCMKTTCISPHNCEKTVDWKDPKFTLFRTIITNGANAGK